MTKAELEKRCAELEQENHRLCNSVEYWNTKYDSLFKEYEQMQKLFETSNGALRDFKGYISKWYPHLMSDELEKEFDYFMFSKGV